LCWSDAGGDCSDYEDAEEPEASAAAGGSSESTLAAIQTQSARHQGDWLLPSLSLFIFLHKAHAVYEDILQSGLIFIPRNSGNILKSVSFCLEPFQRYGVLKNVRRFGPPYSVADAVRVLTVNFLSASL